MATIRQNRYAGPPTSGWYEKDTIVIDVEGTSWRCVESGYPSRFISVDQTEADNDIVFSNEDGVQGKYNAAKKRWEFSSQIVADGAAQNLQMKLYSLAWGYNSQGSNFFAAGNVSYGDESLKLVNTEGGAITSIADAGGGLMTFFTADTGTLAGGELIGASGDYLGFYFVVSVTPNVSLTVAGGTFAGDRTDCIWVRFDKGIYNTAIGTQSGDGLLDGSNNTLFGGKSGYSLVHGSGCLYLGGFSGGSFGDASGQLAFAVDGNDEVRYKDKRSLQLLAGIYADVPYTLKQTGAYVSMVGVATTFVGPYTISDESGYVGITSAGAHGLTAAVAVGNSVYVAAGTNWTAGFYQITAIDTDTTGVKITLALAYDAGLGGDAAIALAGAEVAAYSVTIPGGKLGPNGSLEHRYMFYHENHSGSSGGYAMYLDSHQWVNNNAPVQFSAAGVSGFSNANDETAQWNNSIPGTTGFALQGGDYRSAAHIDTTTDKVWTVTFYTTGPNDVVAFMNNRTVIYPG